MACYNFGNAIVCMSNSWHRLHLEDNRYVFMDYHQYLGPMFFKDRGGVQEIVEWYEDDLIVRALDWFINRGYKA